MGARRLAGANLTGDEAVLRRLANGYALSLDDGEGKRFADVFLPDAKLTVLRHGVSEPWSEVTGRAALMELPGRLQSTYGQTFHFLGQSDYEVGEDAARGVVYCIAHHVIDGQHGGVDHVMHIRYDDVYGRDQAGEWKIADRKVAIRWTETRVTDPVDA